MEKIDILFTAFVIFVVIISCYITYLKIGVNFLVEELAKHHVCLEKLSEAMQHQVDVNEKQTEINKLLSEQLSYSPTGGGKQSN